MKITGGSYATTPDGNLQCSINVAQRGTETLNGVLAYPARGFVADLFGSVGNGTLAVQTATAAPSGGYAISLYGGDKYGLIARIGSVLNVDSPGGISGAGSILDVVDPGAYLSGTDSLAASSVTTPDMCGWVPFQLLSGGTSLLSSLYLADYIFDSNHRQLVEAAGDDYLGVLGGVATRPGRQHGPIHRQLRYRRQLCLRRHWHGQVSNPPGRGSSLLRHWQSSGRHSRPERQIRHDAMESQRLHRLSDREPSWPRNVLGSDRAA